MKSAFVEEVELKEKFIGELNEKIKNSDLTSKALNEKADGLMQCIDDAKNELIEKENHIEQLEANLTKSKRHIESINKKSSELANFLCDARDSLTQKAGEMGKLNETVLLLESELTTC